MRTKPCAAGVRRSRSRRASSSRRSHRMPQVGASTPRTAQLSGLVRRFINRAGCDRRHWPGDGARQQARGPDVCADHGDLQPGAHAQPGTDPSAARAVTSNSAETTRNSLQTDEIQPRRVCNARNDARTPRHAGGKPQTRVLAGRRCVLVYLPLPARFVLHKLCPSIKRRANPAWVQGPGASRRLGRGRGRNRCRFAATSRKQRAQGFARSKLCCRRISKRWRRSSKRCCSASANSGAGLARPIVA